MSPGDALKLVQAISLLPDQFKTSLQEAIDNSYDQVKKISFEKAFFRNDIGAKGLKRLA